MRIVHIVPGSGGTFYCQNCLRDISLVRALRAAGHDVMMVPLYLPMFVDDDKGIQVSPLFFGGINVYLQQKFGIFRHTPRWLRRLLDMKWLLRQAAKSEGATDAAKHGAMTLSMLEGPKGHQAQELERLITWFHTQERPDVIHISNALLLGLAPPLKEALPGTALVCSLQDEEGWLDSLRPPFNADCWAKIAEHAENIDGLVSVSQWYAVEMAGRLQIPAARIQVVPLGINIEDTPLVPRSFDPPVLGYLSKMSEELGIGTLVDAFIELKKNPKLKYLRLRATGGQAGDNRDYVKTLKKKLETHGLLNDAEFLDEFDLPARRAFLHSLSVLCVPATLREAAGMFILEGLATGVPSVQPAIGGFPEFIEATGGGMTYDPETPGALTAALESLLLDPERTNELGARGYAAVREKFSVNRMASDMAAYYTSLVGKN